KRPALLDLIVRVDARANEAGELAVGREAGHAVRHQPAILAIVPAQAVLDAERLSLGLGLLPRRVPGRRILGVDTLEPAMPGFLSRRAAGELEPRPVEPVEVTGAVGGPDEHGGSVRH